MRPARILLWQTVLVSLAVAPLGCGPREADISEGPAAETRPAAADSSSANDAASRAVLVIHGGCGVIGRREMSAELERQHRADLEAALKAGYAELAKPGGTSLDAVEAATKILEDSPLFNAGNGAAFTREGRNELDASIMEGRTRQAGAVAGVTTIKNPIAAARSVMEKSKHVLLAGEGAEQFAEAMGIESVPPAYFFTQARYDQYQAALRLEQEAERAKAEQPAHRDGGHFRHGPRERFGTVGAVALDRAGNLAAGTSTGGMTLKRHGRVGDSPLIGAGNYADNESCAVSATGDGEFFIRAVAAHEISALVRYKGLSLQSAGNEVLRKIKACGGEGGIIVLNTRGEFATPFNTEGMYRGHVTSEGLTHVAIYRGGHNLAELRREEELPWSCE